MRELSKLIKEFQIKSNEAFIGGDKENGECFCDVAELLSELKHFRALGKKGHLTKKIWLIDIQTFVGGKEHINGCGVSPCFFGSLKECQSAIRACAASVYKKLENNKQKPRLVTSYDEEKIAKGAVRVYYK